MPDIFYDTLSTPFSLEDKSSTKSYKYFFV